MDRRRSLLAASMPTFNGVELPTEITAPSLPTEELKNLFSFLSSLTLNGYPVYMINKYDGRFYISAAGTSTNLYQDGSTSSSSGGGA